MVCVVVKHVWLKKQLDKTADEVVREHRRINYDTPTNEMTLIFYRSMKGFDNGIGWKQYTYTVSYTHPNALNDAAAKINSTP